MNNIYPISSCLAIENFEFPQQFIDFLDQFSPPFRSVFENDIQKMGKHAFYLMVGKWASYQLFIGILDLKDIPGRKEFFDHYNNDKIKTRDNRTAPGGEWFRLSV